MKANFNQVLWEKILAIDLTRVFQRLVYKLNFSEDRANAAIEGYRRYLYLINTVGNMTPSEDVDEAWHAHVLHLPTYFRDCMLTFNRVVWHIPKPIMEGKAICSGECNVGDCNPNCRGPEFKPGTDCEAFHNKAEYLSFSVKVPVDEYAGEDKKEIPFFDEVVSAYFA